MIQPFCSSLSTEWGGTEGGVKSPIQNGLNGIIAALKIGYDQQHLTHHTREGRNSMATKSASKDVKVTPLADRVVVRALEETEQMRGGLYIPDTAKEKPTEGIVRALGTGKIDDNGKKQPFEVKVGDRVLVSKYGGTEIKLDGKEFKIFNADDLIAVIE